MDDVTLYQQVYDLIGTHTPLRGDCGALCGAACCAGSRRDGMLVFPGEEALLRQVSHPLFGVKLREFRLEQADLRGLECRFAVCRRGCLHRNGAAARAARPLSCRIFPLAPYLDGDTLTVIPDPRAKAVCPFAETLADRADADPDFPTAVKAAFTLLLTRPGMREFLEAYSAMLDDYRKFLG